MSINNDFFLIVNPNSGRKNFRKSWTLIQNVLNAKKVSYDFEFTRFKKDEIRLVQKAITSGFRKIIVVGGDGTFHHTVNGIMQQNICKSYNIKLGIIPLGTGNDWIKTYQIPNDIKKSIDVILTNKTDYQDIGKIIHKNNAIEYFHNLAGTGYDGYVVQKLNTLKKLGTIAYLLSGLQGLLLYKSFYYNIRFDNKEMNEKCLMVLFGICQYSGGGMQLTQNSNPKDGLLDITIVKNIGLFDIILNLPKLYNGQIVNHKKVENHKVTSIQIELTHHNNSIIEADGELISNGSLEVTIIPKAIQVYIT